MYTMHVVGKLEPLQLSTVTTLEAQFSLAHGFLGIRLDY